MEFRECLQLTFLFCIFFTPQSVCENAAVRRKLGHHTCVCLINQSYFVVPLKVFEVEIKMSGTEKAGSGTTKTPADFLKSIRGRPVVVKLNSGVDYRGSSLYLPLLSENSLKCLWINGYIWVGWCIEYWCVNVWSIFACRSFFLPCWGKGKPDFVDWMRKKVVYLVCWWLVLDFDLNYWFSLDSWVTCIWALPKIVGKGWHMLIPLIYQMLDVSFHIDTILRSYSLWLYDIFLKFLVWE